jgi:hypothetical protein
MSQARPTPPCGDPLNPLSPGGEDWEFWVRMASQFKIRHIASALAIRRIHSKKVSSRFALARMGGKLTALDKMRLQHSYLAHFVAEKESSLFFDAFAHALRAGKPVATGKYLARLIAKYPRELPIRSRKAIRKHFKGRQVARNRRNSEVGKPEG